MIGQGRRFLCDYDVLKAFESCHVCTLSLFSTGKLRSLEEQYSSVVLTVQEQKQLIAQLEEDLRSVNALSTMFRPDAEGEASVTSSSAEFVADAVRELNQACNNKPNTSRNSSSFTKFFDIFHLLFFSSCRYASDIINERGPVCQLRATITISGRLTPANRAKPARTLPQSSSRTGSSKGLVSAFVRTRDVSCFVVVVAIAWSAAAVADASERD